MSELWWTSDESQAIQWCNDQYDQGYRKGVRYPDMFVVKFCGVFYVVNLFELSAHLMNASQSYVVYKRRKALQKIKQHNIQNPVTATAISLFPTNPVLPLRVSS